MRISHSAEQMHDSDYILEIGLIPINAIFLPLIDRIGQRGTVSSSAYSPGSKKAGQNDLLSSKKD